VQIAAIELATILIPVDGVGRPYCYNAGAENTYLRRLGIAEEPVADEIEAFITSGEWIDMLREWDSQLITGGSSSLKTTAPLAGFQWEVDDAGCDIRGCARG
jgi:predicted RecB family nuclease